MGSFIYPTFCFDVLQQAYEFLFFVVGSEGMVLCVGWFSGSSTFFIYSSLSITTMDTPLSAVKITLVLSFVISFINFCSFLEM